MNDTSVSHVGQEWNAREAELGLNHDLCLRADDGIDRQPVTALKLTDPRCELVIEVERIDGGNRRVQNLPQAVPQPANTVAADTGR
jgi:hypothetical protein